MHQFSGLVKRILREGRVGFEPRTQMHIIGISGHQAEYELDKGFPLMTTKNVQFRLPGEEVFWKARGERSVKSLVDKNINFWTANAFDKHLKNTGRHDAIRKHTPEWDLEFKIYEAKVKSGDPNDPEILEMSDLGPVYGFQWRQGFKRGINPIPEAMQPIIDMVRNSGDDINLKALGELIESTYKAHGKPVDQLANIMNNIKKNPVSRYHLLTAWNPSDIPDQALPPCPMIHQFTSFGDVLDLHVYQRSADTYLGVPFNIAQDALLLAMVAKETGQKPGKLVHDTSNTHIYLGVDRGEFWNEKGLIDEFQNKMRNAKHGDQFLEVRDWYIEKAGPEQEANDRKDHLPVALEQLSKYPRKLPSLVLEDVPFFEAIQMPVKEVARVEGYNPHKWDSRAVMAA